MRGSREKLTERWQRVLDEARAVHFLREPFLYEPSRATSPSGGQDVTDFSSNDYLSLRSDPRLVEEAARWGARYGAGAGASRAVISFGASEALEETWAQWLGWEAGMIFPSGFVANLALLEALVAPWAELSGKGSSHPQSAPVALYVDVRAHASVHRACERVPVSRTYFRHGDYAQLRRKIAASSTDMHVILLETLHSMDGTFADGQELTRLCEETGAAIVLDEAHSLGICGPRGDGWLAHFPRLRPFVVAAMYGAGKAAGVAGGFVGCSRELRACLFQVARPFLYSTGVSPLVLGALDAAARILASSEGAQRRLRLRRNADWLRGTLSEEVARPLAEESVRPQLWNAPGSPIFGWVPALPREALGESMESLVMRASSQLLAEGLIVRAMRPPTVPRGTSRLRVIVRESHSEHELLHLSQALRKPQL